MRFTAISIVLILMVTVAVACQTRQTTGGNAPVFATVEVTRIVSDQLVATVQIPVEVTREVFFPVTVPAPVEETPAAPGTAERPVRIVFSPLYGPQVTQLRAQNFSARLSELSGLETELFLPATFDQAVALACEESDRTVAILTAIEYVVAHDRCALEIGYAAMRDGIPWAASMIVVPSGEEAPQAVADLDGQRWGVANQTDFINYLYFRALFDEQEVEPAEVVEFGTDTRTVIGGYDGEVDFFTASFVPPILPYNERLWQYGADDPELWRRTGLEPIQSFIGYIIVGQSRNQYPERGGYQIRDARASAFDVYNDVFARTTILTLSPPIPNDAVAFGAQMPLNVVRRVNRALETLTVAEDCATSLCSDDFFNWEGVSLVDDAFYDSVRFVIEQLELEGTDIFAILQS